MTEHLSSVSVHLKEILLHLTALLQEYLIYPVLLALCIPALYILQQRQASSETTSGGLTRLPTLPRKDRKYQSSANGRSSHNNIHSSPSKRHGGRASSEHSGTMPSRYSSKLAGSHVVILGGTSGIGYAVADQCLSEGCKVSIVSRSREHLNDATERLLDKHHNGNIDRFVADLNSSGAELERTLTKIFKDRDINHVVNTTHDALDVVPLERVDTNYIAACAHMTLMVPIMVAKIASQHLVKPANQTHASMIFTSGSISQKPIPDWTVKGSYATALHGMVRCLALDLAPKGIRVNLVSPGPVDTAYYGDENQRKKMMSEMKKYTLLGKVGSAEDVSESYIYLMKDGNATGSIVSTNSGALLK